MVPVIALSILTVGITTALLVWACFRLVHEAERMQRDPKQVRRYCLVLGSCYIVAAVYGAVQIASGDAPPAGLIGIAIAAMFIWNLIRRVSNVKPPP